MLQLVERLVCVQVNEVNLHATQTVKEGNAVTVSDSEVVNVGTLRSTNTNRPTGAPIIVQYGDNSEYRADLPPQ